MILFVTHFRYSYDIADKINTWAYPVLRYTKNKYTPCKFSWYNFKAIVKLTKYFMYWAIHIVKMNTNKCTS